MKNIIKVAFLSSIITAAMVYVILEWRPLRSDLTRSPESTLASTLAPAALALNLSDDERNNIEIYQKYSQGVVNISTITVGYDFFFGASPRQSGIGSGAIIDTQGRIVTNYHVISDAERIEVTLPDKTKHVAKVVGSDPNNDLAVIKSTFRGVASRQFLSEPRKGSRWVRRSWRSATLMVWIEHSRLESSAHWAAPSRGRTAGRSRT